MSKMHSPIQLPGRCNPYGIAGMPGVVFSGSNGCAPFKYVSFNSVLYATRALFSLLRYWQRDKGALTFDTVIDCIYWLDDPHKVGLKGYISDKCQVSMSDPFDYHADHARQFAKHLAIYVSTYSVKEEDLQCGQNMIL